MNRGAERHLKKLVLKQEMEYIDYSNSAYLAQTAENRTAEAQNEYAHRLKRLEEIERELRQMGQMEIRGRTGSA
jgi:hypothetical protein